MRASLLLLLLAGCDRLFGFAAVPEPETDAPSGGCMVAGAHDDDHDCVPDAVDNCPGLPNPEQRDADDDHIGDMCDPDPLRAGNMQLLFLPNTDPDTAGQWSIDGAWSIYNDALVNADSANGAEEWAYWIQQLSPPLEIETIVHVDTLGAIENKLGLAFAVQPAAPGPPGAVGEFSCAIRRDSQGVHLDAYLASQTSEPLIPNAALRDGAVYTLRARVEATKLECDVQGASPSERQSTTLTGAIAPAGDAAVYTAATAAHYDNIVVYSVVP